MASLMLKPYIPANAATFFKDGEMNLGSFNGPISDLFRLKLRFDQGHDSKLVKAKK